MTRAAGRTRSRSPHQHARQGGYAYLALLILIAIIGVAAAASAQLGEIYQRRMAEKELLFVGGEFQRALLSYANNTPAGQPTQPRTLNDLVRDPRYPNPTHHLRKLYADPMTGKANWIVVKSIDGQSIVGIHSASRAHPIQIANFPTEFQGFEDQKSYWKWVFVARQPQTPGQRTGVAVTPMGVMQDNGNTSSGAITPNGSGTSNGGYGTSNFGNGTSSNGASSQGGTGSSSSGGAYGPNGTSSLGGTLTPGGASPFGGGSQSDTHFYGGASSDGDSGSQSDTP